MRDDAISVSLELDGFRVVGTSEAVDRVEVLIESRDEVGVCPGCGARSHRVHERTQVRIRDVAVYGKPTYLLWRKRRFRCEAPRCPRSTFTENHAQIRPRGRTTSRFRTHLAHRAKRLAVSHVASEERASWWLVWRAITEAVVLSPPEAQMVCRLGIDEACFRRGRRFHTTFVDLDRHTLIDLVPGRSKASVAGWVSERPAEWRAEIAEVVIDPFEAYRKAVRATLPQASLVVDKFHAVRLCNQALDAVRRRLQRERGRWRNRTSRSDHPTRWTRALWSNQLVLAKARARLSFAERTRLHRAFRADPSGELAAAWVLKERFRDWYLAPSAEQAAVGLRAWYDRVERSGVPEFVALARTVRAWEEGLLAHFGSWATNGPTEGITNLIKVVKRQGFGYRNFENFRLRVLFRCG